MVICFAVMRPSLISLAGQLSTILGLATRTSGLSFPVPSGTSGPYSTTSLNASLASTQLAQTDFSNEQLAFLWNQVGPIATGTLNTTVSPTPEPSKFAQPGLLHPLVPSYEAELSGDKLPDTFLWGVTSSSYQIEVNMMTLS